MPPCKEKRRMLTKWGLVDASADYSCIQLRRGQPRGNPWEISANQEQPLSSAKDPVVGAFHQIPDVLIIQPKHILRM